MSSDQKLKAGLAALIGGTVGDVDTLVEAAKIAAAKYIPILREAQRRIEALEGENAALKADNSVWDKERHEALQMWMRKTEAAEQRAERLRVALEKIAEHEPDATSWSVGWARKALEDDKPIRAAAGGGEDPLPHLNDAQKALFVSALLGKHQPGDAGPTTPPKAGEEGK